MKRTIRRGKSSGLLILVVAFLLAVNASLGLLLTRQSSSALITLIHNRMLDISNTAAAMLDGDSLSRLTAEDEGSEEYQSVKDTLTYFQENIELKYIYCIQDAGDGNFVFSVDPTVEDPGEFGSPIVYTDALYRASIGTPAVDEEPYEDAWGSFYSAYSPVFTSDGKVGGIVAVDFSAEWYDRQVSQLIRTVIVVGVVSMLIGVLIVIAITRRDRRRYRVLHGQLNELAGKVGELMREIEPNGTAIAWEGERPGRTAAEPGEGESAEALGAKILSMQDEIRGHIERIHAQAYLDGLTGVGNKAAYLEAVSQIEGQIREDTADFSVAIFDLNGLKTINDDYGHECGDRALVDASMILKEVFGDRLYRIGGDEFTVILEKATQEDVRGLFHRLDEELVKANQAQRPHSALIALSKGASAYLPGADRDFNAVFKRADQAMYQDKRAYYMTHADRRKS